MTSSPVSLLGIGIYTRAEAARFLGLSPARIGSWLRGYRYSWGPRNQRRHGSQPPVLKTDIPRFEGSLAISFLELMELRIVKEFRAQGVPLQTVRVAWENAAKAYQTSHPFADERVFLGGKKIFMAADSDLSSGLLEVSSRHQPFQLVAGPIFKHSLRIVEFDERTHLAREWWPHGKGVPVVLNPAIAFGAPVVADTRVPTTIIARFATAHSPGAVANRAIDRKSTRLNSSHGYISYAVFCLKKKNNQV